MMPGSANSPDVAASVQGVDVPGLEATTVETGTRTPSTEGAGMAGQSIAREATMFVALFGGLWLLQLVVDRGFRWNRGRTKPDHRAISDARTGLLPSRGQIAPVTAGHSGCGPATAGIGPEAGPVVMPSPRPVEPAVSS